MGLWKVWFGGIIIAIAERITVTIIYEKNKCRNVSDFIEVLIQLLIIASIVIVCGIPVSKFAGLFYDLPIWQCILLTIIPAITTYYFVFLALGLYNIKSKMLQALYMFTFIIAIIGLTSEVMDCNKYVREVTQTVIEQTQKGNLVSFANVSTNEICDKTLDEETEKEFKGLFNNVPTSSKIPFCYANENNQEVSDSAMVLNCKIEYIKNNETPHVEIRSYYKCTKIVNLKDGTETIKRNSEKRWKEYTFYLPKAILNYTFKQS